jgi:hypothetical protein
MATRHKINKRTRCTSSCLPGNYAMRSTGSVVFAINNWGVRKRQLTRCPGGLIAVHLRIESYNEAH